MWLIDTLVKTLRNWLVFESFAWALRSLNFRESEFRILFFLVRELVLESRWWQWGVILGVRWLGLEWYRLVRVLDFVVLDLGFVDRLFNLCHWVRIIFNYLVWDNGVLLLATHESICHHGPKSTWLPFFLLFLNFRVCTFSSLWNVVQAILQWGNNWRLLSSQLANLYASLTNLCESWWPSASCVNMSWMKQ